MTSVSGLRLGVFAVLLLEGGVAWAAQSLHTKGRAPRELKESTNYVVFTAAGLRDEQIAAIKADPGVAILTAESGLLRARGLILARLKPGAGSPAIARLRALGGSPAYSLGGADVILSDRVIIDSVKPIDAGPLASIVKTMGVLERLADEPLSNRYILTVHAPADTLSSANALDARADVRFAEPEMLIIERPQPRVPRVAPPAGPLMAHGGFPSDLLFPLQWALHRISSAKVASAHLHALPAWKIATEAAGVTIAILDEGVETTHPDLSKRIVGVFNAVDPAKDQLPPLWAAHGTACAGIAGAETNNSIGIAGTAIGVGILAIRVTDVGPLDDLGEYDWITSTAVLASGIRYAASHGAAVISCSWHAADSSDIRAAVTEALSKGRNGKGSVVVFAAGNSSGAPVEFPASLAGSTAAIAVAATNEWDELKSSGSRDGEDWWGSCFGPEVTLAAPGVHIVTTDTVGPSGYSADDYVQAFNGTSAATPFVAGAAALLIAKHPEFTAVEIKKKLYETADPLGANTDKPFRRLNLCRLLGAASCPD